AERVQCGDRVLGHRDRFVRVAGVVELEGLDLHPLRSRELRRALLVLTRGARGLQGPLRLGKRLVVEEVPSARQWFHGGTPVEKADKSPQTHDDQSPVPSDTHGVLLSLMDGKAHAGRGPYEHDRRNDPRRRLTKLPPTLAALKATFPEAALLRESYAP